MIVSAARRVPSQLARPAVAGPRVVALQPPPLRRLRRACGGRVGGRVRRHRAVRPGVRAAARRGGAHRRRTSAASSTTTGSCSPRSRPCTAGRRRADGGRVSPPRGSSPTSWPTSSAAATCRRSARTTAPSPMPRTRSAALCDRAAAHGLLVGIEWLPYTNIATAADAQAIVEAADRPNGGYCADIWHHKRGADDDVADRALPGRPRVRRADERRPAAARSSTTTSRTAWSIASRPGEGSFDCVGFVRLLADIGVRAPISLEVCSDRAVGGAGGRGGAPSRRRDARRARRGRGVSGARQPGADTTGRRGRALPR